MPATREEIKAEVERWRNSPVIKIITQHGLVGVRVCRSEEYNNVVCQSVQLNDSMSVEDFEGTFGSSSLDDLIPDKTDRGYAESHIHTYLGVQ